MRTHVRPEVSTWAAAVLAAVVIVAVTVRVASLDLEGHNGDVRIMRGWAERLVEVGPLRFYEYEAAIYPALLYPLWLLGAIWDAPDLDRGIEALSIPFDVVIGLVLAHIAGGWRSVTGLLAATLYLLNPGVILAGPVWGQVDAAGTLPFLGALVAAASGRFGVAGLLGGLALLVKPQFGLVLWPVLVIAFLTGRPRRFAAARVVGGAAAAYGVVALPLLLDPIRYLGLLGSTATRQPFTSLNAFNPWGLLVGFKLPDDPYVVVGTAALAVGLVLAVLPLRKNTSLAAVLAVGALVAFAFYFLPTRVHERYLFPVLAVLAPLAVRDRAALVAYLALSAGFAGSIVYALLDTTPFDFPDDLARSITGGVGVWVIGLTLVASAAWWTWWLAISPRRRVTAGRLDRSG